MKFIPAFIKQCLQPARLARMEGLQSLHSDSMPLTAPAKGEFRKKETVDFNSDPPAVSLPFDKHTVPASADNTGESFNPLTRNIHRQQMDIVEKNELPNSSFFDMETENTVNSFTENVHHPAVKQRMDSEINSSNVKSPSINQLNSEPHIDPESVYDVGNNISTEDNTDHNSDPTTQKTPGTKPISQEMVSSYRSNNPQNSAHSKQPDGLTAEQQPIVARPGNSGPAIINQGKKENLPIEATENNPPATSMEQELSLARKLPQASPRSKPTEPPQVRIGQINVLIDDQTAAKPRRKSSSKTAGPSIPFGLRGL